MVDPLSYFSFQPLLHDWCNKGRGMCYPVYFYYYYYFYYYNNNNNNNNNNNPLSRHIITNVFDLLHNTNTSRSRKEMFYLTTHSTHFIYGYMASDIIMVKDHSGSEKGNPPATT